MSAGAIVWLTGLPGSGKTTVARAVIDMLRADGSATLWLDSDDLRPHLVGPGGYDDATRDRFYGALVHLAALGADGGALVVVSATAHRRAWRDAARARAPRFVEVHLTADVGVCAARDPKGLYRAASAGAVVTLPGAGVVYEAPLAPELSIGPVVSAVAAASRIVEAIGAHALPT